MSDKAICFELFDENAFVGTDLKDIAFGKCFDRTLYRFAADAKFFAQFGLGRELTADFQSAFADQTDQLFFDHFGLLSLIVFRHI